MTWRPKGDVELSGTLAVSTSGTERLRIDSAGNVGIGATGPSYRLTVNFDAPAAFGNANGNYAQMWQNSGVNVFGVVVGDDLRSGLVSNNGYSLELGTSGAPRFTINGSTSTINAGATEALPTMFGTRPTFSVHTGGDLTSNDGFGVYRSGADVNGSNISIAKTRGANTLTHGLVSSGDSLGSINWIGSDGAAFVRAAVISASVDGTPGSGDMPGRLTFLTTADGASTPTERMRIDSSGNVGIGTTSPQARLSVGADGDLALQSAVNTAANKGAIKWLIEDNSQGAAIGAVRDAISNAPHSIYFTVRNTSGASVEAMRITNAGNVGIGTGSPGGKLHIAGSAGAVDAIMERGVADASNAYLYFRKDRAGAIVQNGDGLGGVVFQGYSGSAHYNAALISAQVDAAPGASNDMPGRLTFHTTADGSGSVTERMRIDSAGVISAVATNEGNQNIAGDQFFYLGANGSGITTVATNPFGVSPNMTAYGVYEFEYWLGLANSSTGAITLGWAGTTVTRLTAEVLVLPTAAGTAYAGVNPYTATTNAAITGGNTAATYWLKIRGRVVAGNATARLPLQVSVASGTITPQAGSWFKFTNRGVSASGTANITYGNVA